MIFPRILLKFHDIVSLGCTWWWFFNIQCFWCKFLSQSLVSIHTFDFRCFVVMSIWRVAFFATRSWPESMNVFGLKFSMFVFVDLLIDAIVFYNQNFLLDTMDQEQPYIQRNICWTMWWMQSHHNRQRKSG